MCLQWGVVEIPADVAALLEECTVAIWFATVSADLVPQTARSMGAKVERAERVVWLYVPIEQGMRALANVDTGSQIAVTFCRIFDYRAVQVKGTIRSMRTCTEEDRPRVLHYHERFTGASTEVGIPFEAAARLAHWPAIALEIAVRELYSQTPGANAGARL
jgi:hypothetical protein